MHTFSRRDFLNTTAGAMGAATLTEIASAENSDTNTQTGAQSSGQPAGMPAKKQGMRVGMLTAPFFNESFETLANFAKSAGINCLEVVADPGSGLIDVTSFDAGKAEAMKKIVDERGLEISSLAYYSSITDPEKTEEMQNHFKKMIDAASLLGVGVICTMTGYAAPHMNKINTIKKVVPKAFGPVISYAKDKNIKIAVENYFETCLQGIDTFECLFEAVKDENFGLNYDPSHLYHQQCDHLLPVKMFGSRIFHSHGKDTLVDLQERAHVGVYAKGWWRYVLPGLGNINWGEYISTLRDNGYQGVISIEHEDRTFEREAGFIQAARYLNQFC